MDKGSWSSCTFELEDIEIIDHKNEKEEDPGMWSCDQCSLFFLEQGKLNDHKKTHIVQNVVRCKYCDKTISMSEVNRECFLNRKCETCEYKCSKCPQRFLRHSSLVNHEKKHASPKKKRILPGNRKVNDVCPDKVDVSSRGVKRKQSKDSEEQRGGLKKIKRNMNMKISPKKKFNTKIKAQESSGFGENSATKPPKRMSLKADKVEVKKNCENSPVKENKRASLKINKILEENLSPIKNKQNSASVNSQAGPPTANVSSSENVVNYKPFSCHVCGDTFASDGALLSHIKTHGESAAKSFKCKFCGDEFDDIYKMQYHLAICPLAEDELEISLKQVIPVNVSTTFSGGTSSPRKRGRPKKVEPPLNQESCTENEPIQPSVKMGKARKRKSGVLENASQTEPSSKQCKKSLNEETLTASNNKRDAGENVNNTLSSNVTEVTEEVELEEDKKKLHRCPFPRCDFKFTREKALLCHMRNHSDDLDDSLKCHKCDIPFDDVHTLRLHINTCKGIKEEKDDDFNRAGPYDSSPNRTFQRAMKKDFVCNQCGKSHHSQDKLNRCTHENPQTESVVCRICSFKFEDEKCLRMHFTSTHPKNLPFQCPTCKAEFNSTSADYEHRMVHVKHHQVAGQFNCLICSAKFATYKNLYFHYSKDHVEQAQNICKICNITFLNHLALEEHNYVMHQSFDRFKCIFCDKSYRNSVSLTIHLKSHTTKFFKCKICYRPFTDLPTLFKHMLFHATTLRTERPLKCAICLAPYAKQSALKHHISRHISKNTSLFNCLICGETTSDYDSMSNHMFDHSIRITENNMTKEETEWFEGIKDRKPVVKQGRPSLKKNHSSQELKHQVQVENDDPDFKPNIKMDSNETKRGRGRPRNQSENTDEASLKKCVEMMGDCNQPVISQSNQRSHFTRSNGKVIKEINSEECKVSKVIKKKRDTKSAGIRTKTTPKENNKVNDKCTLSSAKKCQKTSNVSVSELNIDKKKPLVLSTKLRNKSNRKSQKVELTSKNDGELYYDPDHEVLEKSYDTTKKKSTEVNEIRNTSQRGNKNKTSTHHHQQPQVETPETNYLETKARPMSFKLFSSKSSRRSHKIVNDELKNNCDLANKELVENPSSGNRDSDVKEDMFDDEDPLGGIEIPYFPARKGLRSSQRYLNGCLDWNSSPNSDNVDEASTLQESSTQQLTTKKSNLLKNGESMQDGGEPMQGAGESRNSNGFIKEKKYFEPSKGLTKYSCTTCLLSFSSQEELLFHNTEHIL